MPADSSHSIYKKFADLAPILERLDQRPEDVQSLRLLLGDKIEDSLQNRSDGLDFLLQAALKLGMKASSAKLLRAAADVYGTDGLQAPVERILKEAGVSRRTFYQHFQNTQELIQTLYVLVLSIGRLAIALELPSLDSPKKKVTYIGQAVFKFYRVGGLLMGKLSAESMGQHSYLNPIYRHHLAVLCQWLAEGTSLSSSRVRYLLISLTAIVNDAQLNIESSPEEQTAIRESIEDYIQIWCNSL